MSGYTLSIVIRAQDRDLLENLLITLETLEGDIRQLSSVEILKVSGPVCLNPASPPGESEPTIQQRNLFLDKWCLQR